MSSVIGLLNGHTLHQDNESSNLNDMNIIVDNGNFNVDYCYINISTGYESKNHNSVDYTKKRYEICTNRYLMENNVLSDGVGIYDMLPSFANNQYVNRWYNN